MTDAETHETPVFTSRRVSARKVVITRAGRKAQAVEQRAADHRADVGLSRLHALLARRLMTYAARLQRGGIPSLGTLIRAAEGVISARTRETNDPAHPDVIALRRCVWHWAQWSGSPMTMEQIRVFGRGDWGSP